MHRRLELLVTFYYVFGGLQMLGTCLLLVVGVLGGLGILEPKDTVQDRVAGAVGAGIMSLALAILGGAHFVVARALRRLQPWARTAAMILSVVDILCCCGCLSLALGVYAFITLLNEDVARLFDVPVSRSHT